VPSIERIIESCERQLTLDGIDEDFTSGGIHYKIGCYKAPTGFYVISCSCGMRSDTGTSAGAAHALFRAHIAGHDNRPVTHDV